MQYGEYRVSSKFSEEAILLGYRGLTLRGILGHALKKENRLRCMIRKKCVHEKSALSPAIEKINIPASSTSHVIEPQADSKTHYRALLLSARPIHQMNLYRTGKSQNTKGLRHKFE